MKRILVFIPILLFSCKGENMDFKEPSVPQPTSTYRPPPVSKYYTFGAVNYSYPDYMDERVTKVLVSGIITTEGAISEDDRYRILDEVSNSYHVTMNPKSTVDKRETYTYSTYAKASEMRQQILKTGIQ
jgi:hypothetical protein